MWKENFPSIGGAQCVFAHLQFFHGVRCKYIQITANQSSPIMHQAEAVNYVPLLDFKKIDHLINTTKHKNLIYISSDD